MKIPIQLKYFYLLLVLPVVSVIFFTGCTAADSKEDGLNQQPVPVKVSKVMRQEVVVPVHTSGRLFPGVQAKLSFKTGGIIEKIYVDQGQAVKKGELLASLDLSEVEAYMKQAENAYAKAKRDKDRVTNLYRDRAATLEQLQDVNTAFEVAKSNREIARFNLKHSKIYAPSGGKILKRLKEVDEMVAAGYPVFLFGSTDNRWVVKAGVNLKEVVKLKIGDRAEVTFDAYPNREFSAGVTEISEAVDPASGTCEVELEIHGQELKLIAGFIAAVDIYPSVRKSYILIPIDALVEAEGSEGFVFIVKDNKAKKVKITILHLLNHHALVPLAFAYIKEVVTDGAPYLTDGSPVKIVK